MTTYFNRYHLKQTKAFYVPCMTLGCRNTPMDIDISVARAFLEYQLQSDPTATLRLSCNHCRQESVWDYTTLLRMTPDELRPIPLPQDAQWVVLLMEIPTADTMPYYAFFGERVLVEDIREEDDSWDGYLVSESQFAPSLRQNDMLVGKILNGYYVCIGLYHDNKMRDLPLEQPQSNLDVGSFLVPKTGNMALLQCANLTCANPLCAHYFGLTYNQLKETLSQMQHKEAQLGGATGYTVLKCEMCQTSRVADLNSFTGLFKL